MRASRRGPDVGATFSSASRRGPDVGANIFKYCRRSQSQCSTRSCRYVVVEPPDCEVLEKDSPGEKKEPSKGFPRLVVVDSQDGWCRNDGGVM